MVHQLREWRWREHVMSNAPMQLLDHSFHGKVCRYKPTEISVTENGFQAKGESNGTADDIFIANDEPRIQYLKEYILEATKAVIYDKV